MFFQNKIQETIVLSVGGSLVVPNGGIDTVFLQGLNKFIRKHVKKKRRFVIIVGGGSITRHYQKAAKKVIGKIGDEDLDWLGIHATRFNAHLVRTILQDIAHPRIIDNYDKTIRNASESVIVGAGWKPGWSTDYDAVVAARDYNASVIINLSNIDYVYDKDPKSYKDAKPIKKTTWDFFEKIVGNEWVPGINAPFDPVASQLAKRTGVTVIIANGKKFANLANILNGESFKGTVITPFKIDTSYYDREYYEGKKSFYKLGYGQSFVSEFFEKIIDLYRALMIKLFLNPKSVLEIGCGRGRLVLYLRKLGVEAYGIEISHYALEAAKKEIRPYLEYGDINNIPHEENAFDAVVSFDVFNHLERSRLRKAMDESIRVSRKWILHKILTTDNLTYRLFGRRDFSNSSILNSQYWQAMFKYIENIIVLRKFPRLPSVFETVYLLRKKTLPM